MQAYINILASVFVLSRTARNGFVIVAKASWNRFPLVKKQSFTKGGVAGEEVELRLERFIYS